MLVYNDVAILNTIVFIADINIIRYDLLNELWETYVNRRRQAL